MCGLVRLTLLLVYVGACQQCSPPQCSKTAVMGRAPRAQELAEKRADSRHCLRRISSHKNSKEFRIKRIVLSIHRHITIVSLIPFIVLHTHNWEQVADGET